MATKPTLPTLVNTGNIQAQLTTINNGYRQIEDEFEKMLSREDNSLPNHMLDALDMDGHKIINVEDGTEGADAVNKSQLDTKEDLLGNPVASGMVLASTVGGDRYWTSDLNVLTPTLNVAPKDAKYLVVSPHPTLTNEYTLVAGAGVTITEGANTLEISADALGGVVDHIDFDTTPTAAPAVGRLVWNDEAGTLDLGVKGGNVNLLIGQKQLIRVVNKTASNMLATNYQVVKISGAQGQRPKIALAQANNDANSADTIGLINENINNNQEGFVCTSGIISNINTTGSLQGETWLDGDVLYLSGTTAGGLTNIKPQAPIHTVIVGFVVYAHNNQGKIFVKVDNGYELDELHNIKINGVTDGQVLAYDSTLSVWENINQSAITSGNSDKVDGYHIQVDGTGTDPNTIYFKTTGGVDPSAAIWGDITGSIVDQTDLYNALVNGTYATGNWNINAASVDGYSVQVDGTGTDPNTIYFKTTGGTISVDWDDVANTPTTVSGYGITDAVTTSGNQTIGGTKTFSSTITGSITGNADTVDGYNVQVDGTGTDPNTIYFKTTGGSISVDWDDVSNTPTTVAGYGITDAVTTSGNQTVGGTKTFSSTISGSVSGNAGTVTNGVYTSGDQTIGGTKTFSSTISGSIDGNSNTVDGYHVQVDGTGTDPNTIYFKTTGGGIGVDWDDISNTPTTVAGYGITDAVTTSGNQTIGGTKTFSSTITGSITGNAGTVTNGVYTTGDQTIGGTKTFSSAIAGSITGNAATVTNGVYTTGDQTIGGTKTFSSTISGSVSGNAGTATTLQATPTINNVTFAGNANITVPRVRALDDRILAPADGSANYVTAYFTSWANDNTSPYADALLFRTWADGSGGNDNLVTFRKNAFGMRIWQQTSGSATAFSSFKDVAWTDGTNATGTWTISTSGNAGTVTNGVYTTGDQTIGGNKTFTGTTSITNGPLVLPAASGANSFISGTGDGASLSTYNFALSGWNGMAFYNPTVGGVYPTSTTGVVNFRDGIIEMRGSLRAPIFYDSADTSYYLDPANAGTSMAVAGNVGIGTASPVNKLTISGSSLASGEIGTLAVSGSTTAKRLSIGVDSTSTMYSWIQSVEAGIAHRSLALQPIGGNVGIGTTSPVTKLDINGDVNTAQNSFIASNLYFSGGWKYKENGYGGFLKLAESAGGVSLYTSGLNSSGSGASATVIQAIVASASGSVTAPVDMRSPIFYDSNNTAFYVNPNGTSNISALVMNDLLTGRSSASTDVNGANDTGSFSVRGSSTTVASMSFHRTGAYAINMGLGTDNVFRIGGWSASNNCLQMDGSGNLTMLNNVTAYSDARLKTDVVKIENALDKVQQLNGYTYTRTDTGSKQTGVIAQEVMKVLPEVVMGSEDTHYSVAYGNMVGLLIEAIKEQQGQINELKLTIEQLKGN